MPAATAAAEPPDDPPGVCARLQGLWISPKSEIRSPPRAIVAMASATCKGVASKYPCPIAMFRSSPLVNRGRDYLANMTIEEAIYRSHDQGRRIELPQRAPYKE